MDHEENRVPMTPSTGGNCTAGDDMTVGLPIAMAYVPWQEWKRLYAPSAALENGTLFEELDLPFLGSQRGREE